MCMAAGVPLVESGTAGYLGQVQPLLKVMDVVADAVSSLKHSLSRIARNALTVCQSLHRPPFRCARSGLRRLNLSIALSGRRAIYFRKFGLLLMYFSYTFCDIRQLFGEDEDGTNELDEAEKQGENGSI
jgi:ubiquitin-like 1-activating enzyme E1 B